jgi:hypothetical protein
MPINMSNKTKSWAICSILAFFALAQAQSSNLTIAFSPASLDSCASPSNASEAGGIIFTTAGVPAENECFNLDELFSGPSNGLVTQNGTAAFPSSNPQNFTYSISNQEAYDPSMNYSRVFYQQSYPEAPSPSDQDELPDDTALRIFHLFSDVDCRSAINQTREVGQRVLPWYGYSCLSDGQCNEAAINAKSFMIGDSTLRINRGWADTCREFAYEGAGQRSSVHVGLVVCVSMLGMLG